MITRKDIAAHLEYSVKTGFLMGQKEYTPLRSAFCREVPSSGAFETYADMNVSPWPNLNSGKAGAGGTDDNGAPIAGQINAGRQITVWGGGEVALKVNNLDYEIAIGITHNAIEDNRAGDLETWARQAARTFQKHQDYLCFHALNNGESTAYYGAGYDGLSFFNDSHKDPGVTYQTTQDNKYAVALSFDNFKTVKIAASKFKDGNGQPVGMNHNLLIVPTDLEYEAAQICVNRDVYGTGNRNLNPYAGTIKPLVAPGGWLDTTAWFLVDPNELVKPLYLQMRQQPALTVVDDEFSGDGATRYYIYRARYNVFYGNWRYCIEGNS